MLFEMKDNRTGGPAPYKTTLELIEDAQTLTFIFRCENTQFYCPYKNYNEMISRGDICEIHVGTDPERKEYFEISITQENNMFISRHIHGGFDENGKAILTLNLQPRFPESHVEIDGNNYTATVKFKKSDIRTCEGDIYFNAYRIETDGGHMEKHLMAVFPTCSGAFNTPKCFRYLKDFQ